MWHRVVEKTPYEIDILFITNNELEANEKEIEFIKLYGRVDEGTGTLVNMTKGGDGAVGRIVTPEVAEKYRQTNLGRKLSQHHKEKLRAANLGRKISDETRLKMSVSAKKNVKNIEDFIVMSKSRAGLKNKLTHNEKVRIARLGKTHSEFTKQKIRSSKINNIDDINKLIAMCKRRAKPVIQYSRTEKFIKEWTSAVEVANYFGCSRSAVNKTCRGTGVNGNSLAVFRDFIWKYKTL